MIDEIFFKAGDKPLYPPDSIYGDVHGAFFFFLSQICFLASSVGNAITVT